MRDPLPKNNFHRQTNTYGRAALTNAKHNSNAAPQKKKKPDYRWNFNKGIKCKFGARCKFIEHCSYCDSPNHGIHVCPKAKNDNVVSSNGNNSHPQGTNSGGGDKK